MCDYRAVGSVLTWAKFRHVRVITSNWNAMFIWPKQLSRVLFNYFDLVAVSSPITQWRLNKISVWCKMASSKFLPSLRLPSSSFHRSSQFRYQIFDPTGSWYRLFACSENSCLLVVARRSPTLKIVLAIHHQSLIGFHWSLALDVEFQRNVLRGSSQKVAYIDRHV